MTYRKTMFISLFILLLPFFSLVTSTRSSALSVAECSEDTRECKIQNCETDILVKNWPENTGYTRDCEKEYGNYATQKMLLIATGIVGVTVIGIVLVRRNNARGKKGL